MNQLKSTISNLPSGVYITFPLPYIADALGVDDGKWAVDYHAGVTSDISGGHVWVELKFKPVEVVL